MGGGRHFSSWPLPRRCCPCRCSLLLASLYSVLATAAAVVLARLAGSLSAVGASAIPEQFDLRGRPTALAIAEAIATPIFGGITPYADQALTEAITWPPVPGLLIAAALATSPPFNTIRRDGCRAQGRNREQ